MPTKDLKQAEKAEVEKRARRLAKIRKPFYPTATLAAQALNVAVPTYSSHENGARVIKEHVADVYARHFGVNTEWLMHGDGKEKREDPPDPSAVMAQSSNQRIMSRNPLLAIYDVFRSPTGYTTTPTSKRDHVIDLHRFEESDGYIPELELKGEEGSGERRLVRIPGQESRLFLLQNFVSPGIRQTNSRFLIALRINTLNIFGDADILVVDPMNREPTNEGVFVLLNKDNMIAVYVPEPVLSFGEDQPESSRVSFYLQRQGAKQELERERFKELCIGQCMKVVHSLAPGDAFYAGFV